MPGHFYAIRCRCGCIHGWIDHPMVMKITQDLRSSMEHIWRCPSCNMEHRTTDGTLLGRPHKEYEEIHSEEEIREMQRREIEEHLNGYGGRGRDFRPY